MCVSVRPIPSDNLVPVREVASELHLPRLSSQGLEGAKLHMWLLLNQTYLLWSPPGTGTGEGEIIGIRDRSLIGSSVAS